jgi:hypothetical protein
MGERDLASLQREWYRRLKDAGFEDIEYQSSNMLKGQSIQDSRRINPHEIAAVEEYYRLASQFLHDHEWNDNTEKLIWALYAEGIPYRAIAKELHITLWRTQTTIRKISSTMFKIYRIER